MVTTVMLVDDHQLMREVLVHVLSHEEDLEVIAVAADALESVARVRTAVPDVVVMDVDLPRVDGIAATRVLLALRPSTKVVMLSASCSETLVRESAVAGACGYLLKGGPVTQLAEGIRAAARGEHPMAPEVLAVCRSLAAAEVPGRAGGTTEAAAWCRGATP